MTINTRSCFIHRILRLQEKHSLPCLIQTNELLFDSKNGLDMRRRENIGFHKHTKLHKIVYDIVMEFVQTRYDHKLEDLPNGTLDMRKRNNRGYDKYWRILKSDVVVVTQLLKSIQ